MATHTRRCIEILQAAESLKTIYRRKHGNPQWHVFIHDQASGWNFDDYEYKIDGETEEPEYRPWTFEEIPVGIILKSKKGWIEGMVTRKERGFEGKVDKVWIGDVKHTAATLLREFITQKTGQPCGVKK